MSNRQKKRQAMAVALGIDGGSSTATAAEAVNIML
jgi:activator of 2-hydroxyglutaryl-CoA dehydratase